MIKSLSTLAVLSVFSAAVFAAPPECELIADQAWLEQDVIEKQIQEQGYVIDDLVVSEGNCFEVTGKNKDGQDITAFFHPQTGVVQQEDVAQ